LFMLFQGGFTWSLDNLYEIPQNWYVCICYIYILSRYT
jgi:hypothetical protein